MSAQLSESEIRAMRDRVYDQTSSDNNWDACREFWIRPSEVEWLIEKSNNPTSATSGERMM